MASSKYWNSASRQRSTSISRLSELPRGWSERWDGSKLQRRQPRCQSSSLDHRLFSVLITVIGGVLKLLDLSF